MTAETRSAAIRRVAVALDASPHSLEGLALAARIAAALGAEVEGVFIEDTKLLDSAGLPFLREVRVTTLGESAMDAARLQRELRAAARWMREQLERSASELGVACSFRVWRGDLEAEILGAALDAELFTLGRIGRFAPLRRRPKTRQARPAPTVGVLFNARVGAAHALETAKALSNQHDASLVVILQPGDETDLPSLRAKALEKLADREEPARLVVLDSAASLGPLVASAGIELLIVDAGNAILSRPSLWASLEALDCPIVIGR